MWGLYLLGTSPLYLWGLSFVAGWLVGGWPEEDVSANQQLQSRSKRHGAPCLDPGSHLNPCWPGASLYQGPRLAASVAGRLGGNCSQSTSSPSSTAASPAGFPLSSKDPKVQRHEHITFCHRAREEVLGTITFYYTFSVLLFVSVANLFLLSCSYSSPPPLCTASQSNLNANVREATTRD